MSTTDRQTNDSHPTPPSAAAPEDGGVEPLAVSLADAARLLNVSEMTLSKAINEGTVGATKITGGRSARWVIPITEIHRVLGNAGVEAELRRRAHAQATNATPLQPEAFGGGVEYRDEFNGFAGSGFEDEDADETFLSDEEVAAKRAADEAERLSAAEKRRAELRELARSRERHETNRWAAQAHMDKRVAEAVQQARAEIARGDHAGYQA